MAEITQHMISPDQRLAMLLMGDFVGLLTEVFERGREELVLMQSAAVTPGVRLQHLQEGCLFISILTSC